MYYLFSLAITSLNAYNEWGEEIVVIHNYFKTSALILKTSVLLVFIRFIHTQEAFTHESHSQMIITPPRGEGGSVMYALHTNKISYKLTTWGGYYRQLMQFPCKKTIKCVYYKYNSHIYKRGEVAASRAFSLFFFWVFVFISFFFHVQVECKP